MKKVDLNHEKGGGRESTPCDAVVVPQYIEGKTLTHIDYCLVPHPCLLDQHAVLGLLTTDRKLVAYDTAVGIHLNLLVRVFDRELRRAA